MIVPPNSIPWKTPMAVPRLSDPNRFTMKVMETAKKKGAPKPFNALTKTS